MGIRVAIVQLPIVVDVVIMFSAYIFTIEVPLLLEIAVLQIIKLLVKFNTKFISSIFGDWRIKDFYKTGYLYVEWPPFLYYTEKALNPIYRHFYQRDMDKCELL